MNADTVVRLRPPGASVAGEPLLEVLRCGARRMPQQVIEAEVEAFPVARAVLEELHAVRNGHAPERAIRTGIGPTAMRRRKVRDRGDGASSRRSRFTAKVLPPLSRRSKKVEELLPPPASPGAVSFGDRMPPGVSWGR